MAGIEAAAELHPLGALTTHAMKNLEDKVFYAIYGLFGASLGFLIYAIALGGWRYLLIGRQVRSWNGLVALIICVGLGFGWGILSYRFKDREFDSGASHFYHDEATAFLFTKRLMVVATCLAGLYFVWQLARSV